MARPTKEQKRKIKRIEKDIKEEASLWGRIKAISKLDKSSSKRFKELFKSSKVTRKPRVPKSMKKRVNETFWGLEPPLKPKKSAKKKTKKKAKL